MKSAEDDPVIAQLEADLRDSRFKKWDVENYLVGRHKAKIEALENPRSDWAACWTAAKEMSDAALIFVGRIAIVTMVGYWLLTGSLMP